MKFVEFGTGLKLPENAATQVYAFMGKRGSGKTYGAGKLAEVLLEAKVQVIVMDPVGNWWGLRVGAKGEGWQGFDIPILGGEHGDIPLASEAGEVVADMLVDTGSSAVLDVSPFSKTARRRFIAEFCERFFQRKKTRRSAVHVFIEEAHLVLPQHVGKGEERMLGAVEDLVRLGRNYGIGVSMLDQRPQSVSKEALNQAEVLLAFQLIGAHERDAISKWISYHGVGADLAKLTKLKPGEAIVWAPWLDAPGVYRINKKRTFDSSATPEAGEEYDDVKLGRINLPELDAAMQKVVADSKADDPKALKLQVAGLLARESSLTAMLERIGTIVFGDMVGMSIDSVEDGVRDLSTQQAGWGPEDVEALTTIKERTDFVLQRAERQLVDKATKPKTKPLLPKSVATPAFKPKRHDGERSTSPSPASSPARGAFAILAAIRYLNRPTRVDEAAILAGYSTGASTVSVYFAKLKRDGMLTEHGRGLYTLSSRGAAACKGVADPLPPAQRLAVWVRELGRAGEILWAIASYTVSDVSFDTLCSICNVSPNASTMSVYLAKLKKKGLVESQTRGTYCVTPLMYLEPSR